jgi:hypothetical protein
MSVKPRPAPCAYSPSAASLASFSMAAGTFKSSAMVRTTGNSCQPGRLMGSRTVPRSLSTEPGQPMPTAFSLAPASAHISLRTDAMLPRIISGPSSARVGNWRALILSSSLDSSATAILVPPMSTPATASVISLDLPLRETISHAKTQRRKGRAASFIRAPFAARKKFYTDHARCYAGKHRERTRL